MRRTRQDLAALLGSMGHPAVLASISWGSAVAACPLATKGGYAGAVCAAFLFSLSLLFLGYVLGSGALAFVVDAERSCLPRTRRLTRRAYLVGAVLLLPALVLPMGALAGNPVWRGWMPTALVLAVALVGVLAPRRPASAVGLLLLVVLGACWAASGAAGLEQGKAWRFACLAAAVVLLPAALVLLGLASQQRMIRPGSRGPGIAERLRAIRTPMGRRGALERATWRSSTRHSTWGRQSPVQIVRRCLGGIFAQLSRQLILGAVLLALFIAAATGLPWLGLDGRRWAVIVLALAAAALLSSGFLIQLSRLTRGQVAELALIPGLGPAAAQRRALYRVVLTPPLLWLVVVLVFGAADLLLKGERLSSVRMLAVSLFIVWLAYTLLALQKLAALPPKRQSAISEFMLLCLVVYAFGAYYWVYVTSPQFDRWFWFWITPVLISVGIVSTIGFSVRRLATAPHPFLSRGT